MFLIWKSLTLLRPQYAIRTSIYKAHILQNGQVTPFSYPGPVQDILDPHNPAHPHSSLGPGADLLLLG